MRIGKYLISTEVNGPGKRFVIWFQGCPFHCKRCFNPEFWNKNAGKVMNVKEILSIIDKYPGIEGVTFTGGEPFLQSKELLSLSKLIRCKNLTIVCFTGYQYEDILKGKIPYGKELLNYIDILIDGRFIKEEKTFLIWRGSRNQKVYFLSERYKYLKEFVEKEGRSEAEIKVGKKGISITGIFDINFWEELKKALKEND